MHIHAFGTYSFHHGWSYLEPPLFQAAGYGNHLPVKLIRARGYHSIPNSITGVVLVADSFEQMCCSLWLVPLLHELIEDADVVIFATYEELPHVGAFFSQPLHKREHVLRALCMQQATFPRMHFFTLSSAMGQELQDSSIISPAVTVGAAGKAGIPLRKFNVFEDEHGKFSLGKFFLLDADMRPMTERALPGKNAWLILTLTLTHD